MLRELKAALVKGETIPLVITWTNFQRSRTMTVQAKVVAAPSDIDFGMSALGM
jgi:copper(I)-binding protein